MALKPVTFNKDKLYFSFLILFFIGGLIRIFRHEMWLDETEPWLLARDSASFAEMLYNKRYEGHPALWYSILFIITRFTTNVSVMQILHVFIMTGFVYLFLKSPFNFYFKILFCLGYFIFYEYLILSRLYAPGLLLTACLCYLYQHKNKNPLLLSPLLFLLAQTNLFGLIFTCGFLLLLTYEHLSKPAVPGNRQFGTTILGFSLVSAGILLAIYSMIPPADTYFAAGWNFRWEMENILKVLGALWTGFVPFPIIYVEFWNYNIIQSVNYRATLGIIIYILTLSYFFRSPKVLLLYLFLTTSILSFFYIKFFGTTRHHGHLFMAFIFCLWLLPAVKNPFAGSHSFFTQKSIRHWGIYLILFINISAGVFASAIDWVYPFAPNKQASIFLKQFRYEYILVAQDNFHTSSVSAYLNKLIYFPKLKKFGSFYQLAYRDKKETTSTETIQAGFNLQKRLKKPVIVILNEKLEAFKSFKNLKEVYITDGSILGKPVYHLYLISNN